MNETLQAIDQYMFSSENMKKHNNYRYNFKPHHLTKTLNVQKEPPQINGMNDDNGNNNNNNSIITKCNSETSAIKTPFVPATFIPSQKDKLFWCFFIIMYGYEEYEINRINSFTNEKRIKIETVENLKQIKDRLKELKLKRTELEEELVSKPTISLKGLTAMCILHNVSITYVYGRKYCIINSDMNDLTKVGVIVQNKKKEDAIKWIKHSENTTLSDSMHSDSMHSDSMHSDSMHSEIEEYLNKIKTEYWHIENIQKPLKTPSAYSSSELHDICNKLEIDIQVKSETTGKLKSKTKKQLYDEILQYI